MNAFFILLYAIMYYIYGLDQLTHNAFQFKIRKSINNQKSSSGPTKYLRYAR